MSRKCMVLEANFVFSLWRQPGSTGEIVEADRITAPHALALLVHLRKAIERECLMAWGETQVELEGKQACNKLILNIVIERKEYTRYGK